MAVVRRRAEVRAVLVCVWLVLDAALGRPGAQEHAPRPHVEGAPAEADTREGIVSGTIIDEATGDPILEAVVEVVGRPGRHLTNLEGKYSFRLPAGTYQVRVYAPLYQSIRLEAVAVRPGQVTRVDAAMTSTGQAGVEVVEVVAEAKKKTEERQLVERKRASTVKDTISAETMAKTPGSDVADIVARTPSVTIREDRFIYVRGLGERYTSALLNGSRLPSPDPLRRVVPLDIFPVDFLDSISVVKTYSPDLPGDFSGGLVEIDLKDFPSQLSYDLSASTGFNTQTTGKPFLTYRGFPRDYLGWGAAPRNPPKDLPGFNISDPNSGLTPGEVDAIGRSFQDIWTPQTTAAPPDWGLDAAVGNTWGPFGLQLGGLYSNDWRTVPNARTRQFTNSGTPENPEIAESTSFAVDRGTFSTRLSGVLTAAYEPTQRHKFAFRMFANQSSADQTRLEFGVTPQIATGGLIRQTRLRYVAERLVYGQVAGQHALTDWLQVDWRTALARTNRDEPDTRHTTYDRGPGEPFTFTTDSLGGLRYTNETVEKLSDTMVDFTVPFKTRLPFTKVWDDLPAKLKFGPAYSYRKRRFGQRLFEFSPFAGAVDLSLPAEDILAPSNIVPGVVDFRETTQPPDSFRASQRITGGYGLLDLPIIRDRLRVIGGLRAESSQIRLDTFIENVGTVPGEPPLPIEFRCRSRDATFCFKTYRKDTLDPLPAVSVIVNPVDDMNVRLAWGKSVARPEFRELAPTSFPTQRGERATFGNPTLVETKITSWDARWEWFFSPLELASVGFFYKTLDQPIEPVVIQSATELQNSWTNGIDGWLMGVEMELRKDFGFIHPRLEPLSLATNVTWSDSLVRLGNQPIFGTTSVQTSAQRRLAGQAPFIVNAALDYTNPDLFTARLLYFTAGESLEFGGANGLPDIFLQRRNQLDAVVIVPLERWLGVGVNVKLGAENLFNAPYVLTQGPEVQERFTKGVRFSFSVSYSN